MDASDQIQKFKEFIEENYIEILMEKIRIGENFIVLDFKTLSEFELDLANLLLDDPEEVIKAAELSIQEFEVPKWMKRFYVRFDNLPDN